MGFVRRHRVNWNRVERWSRPSLSIRLYIVEAFVENSVTIGCARPVSRLLLHTTLRSHRHNRSCFSSCRSFLYTIRTYARVHTRYVRVQLNQYTRKERTSYLWQPTYRPAKLHLSKLVPLASNCNERFLPMI